MSDSAKQIAGKISDIDLRLLRVFKAVVECRGFAAAEHSLGIGRSTISTHMSDLEARFGMRLCERGRGGFALTERGQQAYEATLRLLQALDNYRAEISDIHGEIAGELDIGLVDNMITDPTNPMIPLLRELADTSRRIHPRLHVFSPDEIERRLLDGRLHLGILPGYRDVPGLDYEFLYEEVNSLYCGKGHPYFHTPPASMEGLWDKAGYVAHGYLDPKSHHGPQPDPRPANRQARATTYNMEGMAMLILSGRYVGFLPDHYAAQGANTRRMRQICPDLYAFKTRMVMATRAGQRPSRAMQVLRGLLSARTTRQTASRL